MEKGITVDARFEPDGSIRPLSFMLREKHYRVDSLGRQWEQDDEQHFLVMTPDNIVYELIYLRQQGKWALGRYPQKQDHRRDFV